MKTEHGRARTRALLLIGTLAAGCAYSAVASLRLYVGLFGAPAAHGAESSIDAIVAPLNATSSAIRNAVALAGWPHDAEVALVLDARHLEDVTRIRYAMSYVLYPKRIRLDTARSGAGYAIVIGSPGQVASSRAYAVSDVITLVELP